MNTDEIVKKLSVMFDNVETEYQQGEISIEERDERQREIMETWRVIQP